MAMFQALKCVKKCNKVNNIKMYQIRERTFKGRLLE